ncbi:hypothetical protein GCM10018787_43640 [Streptomyces thermodiastaticus]|nr:hypothetical protein GCM10018787_43640 [Streptomyces thermodiastaticus]
MLSSVPGRADNRTIILTISGNAPGQGMCGQADMREAGRPRCGAAGFPVRLW